jgi:hypothetical protein
MLLPDGRLAITGDTALRLAHSLGTTAEFWLNLQSLYEIRVAQKKAGKSIKELPTLKRRVHTHRTPTHYPRFGRATLSYRETIRLSNTGENGRPITTACRVLRA